MLKKIQVIKNFYDDEIKRKLNNWTLINYKNDYKFRHAHNNPPGTSFTTRWTEKGVDFPQEAFDLRQKIIQVLEFKEYSFRYTHGIINTVNYPGCEVYEHIDQADKENHVIYHCNIVTKKSTGGETVIDGVEYDLQENDLLCYAVSDFRHKVNLIRGPKLRMMWIFGFNIPEIEFYEYKKI